MAGSGGASFFLGLASALAWGAGDFGGGLAARRHGLFATLPTSQAIGLALLSAALVASGESLPTVDSLAWSAGAGLAGAAGLAAYYRALAIGRMGLSAPVGAAVGAMVPVVAGALLDGFPGLLTLFGFGLAMAGIWLVSRPAGTARPGVEIWLAVGSGFGFGTFFVLLGQVETGLLWPVTIARSASLLAVVGFAWTIGRLRAPPLAALPLAGTAGTLDGAGNLLFLLAVQAGRLDVAAVLTSTYPVATILLAGLLLRETLIRRQWLGVILTLGALPLIASGG